MYVCVSLQDEYVFLGAETFRVENVCVCVCVCVLVTWMGGGRTGGKQIKLGKALQSKGSWPPPTLLPKLATFPPREWGLNGKISVSVWHVAEEAKENVDGM